MVQQESRKNVTKIMSEIPEVVESLTGINLINLISSLKHLPLK